MGPTSGRESHPYNVGYAALSFCAKSLVGTIRKVDYGAVRRSVPG
jgi:hypothetical protein